MPSLWKLNKEIRDAQQQLLKEISIDGLVKLEEDVLPVGGILAKDMSTVMVPRRIKLEKTKKILAAYQPISRFIVDNHTKDYSKLIEIIETDISSIVKRINQDFSGYGYRVNAYHIYNLERGLSLSDSTKECLPFIGWDNILSEPTSDNFELGWHYNLNLFWIKHSIFNKIYFTKEILYMKNLIMRIYYKNKDN